ncbi:C40 family peptidase [Streptomyces gobitricini]|uniref:C40 family peptidase n=1 Tax=Streptomyces gobitricini TaxID=68211 RepID=A0ABN3N694_9ACTN
MASHRKPRASRTLQTLHAHSPAVGVTTAAALASVTLLSSQSATAAPGAAGDPERKPTVEEVQRKVDDLYRQAGTATRQYGSTKQTKQTERAERAERAGRAERAERAGRAGWAGRAAQAGQTAQAGEERWREAGGTRDDATRRTEAPHDSRHTPGPHAAPQHRSGGRAPATSPAFPDMPRAFVEQAQPVDRLTDRRHESLTGSPAQQPHTAHQRAEATRQPPESLSASQASLRATKQAVQRKLGDARALLALLTAGERARAEAGAAEVPERHEQWREQPQQPHTQMQAQADDESGHTAKAREVVAFAEAQTGKPYVWGATGPSSYDCSGLTQAAWRAAGVDLPRTTWEQARAGTRVRTEDLRPGDLVFFHDDISHVGICKGGGKMIHAPGPGEDVREESIHHMPIHSSVRPA